MARMQYQFTSSLDGFIAGPGGDMSWLSPYLGGSSEAGAALAGQTGALLVGNRTFGGDDPLKGTDHEGEPYGGGWAGPQFVLTHNPPDTPVPGVTFVDDLGRAVDLARQAAGDKVVGVLGADVARQCIEAGLLDEIWVSVLPVLLGDGVRMFDWPGGTNVRLERVSLAEGQLSTDLRYRVRR